MFSFCLLKGVRFPEFSALKTCHIRPAVGLRFEVGPGAAVHSPLATKNGFLHLLLQGCDLELVTSVLNSLGPFLEDEEVPVVVPMQVELRNSRITLKVRGTLGFSPRLCQAGTSSSGLLLTSCLLTLECGEGRVRECVLAFLVRVTALCERVLLLERPGFRSGDLVCSPSLVFGVRTI